jgi:hypothetical protein
MSASNQNTQDTRVTSDWEAALHVNNGDYAYAPDGGMINHEVHGSYTVQNGNLQAACVGNWAEVERKGVSKEDIPGALQELNIPLTGWTYE